MRKRFGVVLLISVLAFVLIGCGATSESPEQAVETALSAVKNFDQETAQRYFESGGLFNENSKAPEKDLLKGEENAKLIVEKIDFKVLSSSVAGDTATVKTEISNVDMKNILSEYVGQVMPLAFSNAFSGNALSQEEMDKQAEQIFLNLLKRKENPVMTSTVDIQLTKAGENWRIDMDEKLQNALLGGFISASDELEKGFGGGDSPQSKLKEMSNYITSDIWNDGFCHISWYLETGKNSIGETMDIDFTLQQLAEAMKKKTEYDAYINGLEPDKYAKVKQIWSKLSPEINRLYGQIQEKKPTAKNSSYNFDTGLFKQYQDAFGDAVHELNE